MVTVQKLELEQTVHRSGARDRQLGRGERGDKEPGLGRQKGWGRYMEQGHRGRVKGRGQQMGLKNGKKSVWGRGK